MTVKLVMLKSGEDVIADVKEIKSNEEVIGYYFDNPLLVKMYESENEPTVLNESSTTKEYASKVGITFFPWVPLSKDTRIPCSADWVVTITEPVENLKKLYQERLDGRHKGNQSPIVVQSGDSSIGD